MVKIRMSVRKVAEVWDLVQFMRGDSHSPDHYAYRQHKGGPHFGVRYGLFRYTNNTTQPFAV